MMPQAILIVGGYGMVGRVVASRLAVRTVGRIIIAGRRREQAEALAKGLGACAQARFIDTANANTYDVALAGVSLVIMCSDLSGTALVRECLTRGINYIDLTGELGLMKEITALDAVAREGKATAVISVGLIPGLSNLLAQHGVSETPGANEVRSAFLIGMGEEHGVAALCWAFGHLADPGMQPPASMDFGTPYGRRTVLHYALPDQYTLLGTLPIRAASSWLCMGSAFMTRFMHWLRVFGLTRIFKKQSFLRWFAGWARRVRFGSKECVLTTQVVGPDNTYQAWARASGESYITGLVAAEVASLLVTRPQPAGVYHIEQLLRLENLLPALEAQGVTFEETRTPSAQ